MAVTGEILEGLARTLTSTLRAKKVGAGTRGRVLTAASEYLGKLDEAGSFDMEEALKKIQNVAERAGDASIDGRSGDVANILNELVPPKVKKPVRPKDPEQDAMTRRVKRSNMSDVDMKESERLSDSAVSRLLGESSTAKEAVEKAGEAAKTITASNKAKRTSKSSSAKPKVVEAKSETPKAAKPKSSKPKAAKKEGAPATGEDKVAKRESNRAAWYAKNADSYDETRKRLGKPAMSKKERAEYIAKIAKQAEEARKRKGK